MTLIQLFKEIGKLNDEQFTQFRAGFATMEKDRASRALFKYSVGDVVKFQSSRRKHNYREIVIQISGRGSKRLVGVEVDAKTLKPLPFAPRWKVPPVMCTLVKGSHS